MHQDIKKPPKRVFKEKVVYLDHRRKEKELEKKTVNTGIYLIGHGVYKSPRFIELQIFRINKFLNTIDSEREYGLIFKVVRAYLDLNAPRGNLIYPTIGEFPGLSELVLDAKKGKIKAVLIDLKLDIPFSNYEYYPLLDTFNYVGLKVFNVFYEIKKMNSGKDNTIDDFFALFPGLCGDILDNVKHRMITDGDGDLRKLDVYIKRLRKENPYGSSRWWRSLKEVPVHMRKEFIKADGDYKEILGPLILLGPYEDGQFLCELRCESRSHDEMNQTIKRLCEEVGFEKRTKDGKFSMTYEYGEHIVYADPRPKNKITFYVYKRDVYRYKRTENCWGDFSIRDSGKSNLKGKFLRQLCRFLDDQKRKWLHLKVHNP